MDPTGEQALRGTSGTKKRLPLQLQLVGGNREPMVIEIEYEQQKTGEAPPK